MRFRSFVIAYALVLALLLSADRRPQAPQNRYSKVVDLTAGPALNAAGGHQTSGTRIVSPAALIPGTWGAGQIPAERLIAPLVVIDVNPGTQLSVDDIAAWESHFGSVPQGAVVALRIKQTSARDSASEFPMTADAAQFLMEARYTLGFVVETPAAALASDLTLSRQLALHGNYVVEGSSGMASLPEIGSLLIVAPARNTRQGTTSVRVLAMVR